MKFKVILLNRFLFFRLLFLCCCCAILCRLVSPSLFSLSLGLNPDHYFIIYFVPFLCGQLYEILDPVNPPPSRVPCVRYTCPYRCRACDAFEISFEISSKSTCLVIRFVLCRCDQAAYMLPDVTCDWTQVPLCFHLAACSTFALLRERKRILSHYSFAYWMSVLSYFTSGLGPNRAGWCGSGACLR